MLRDMLSLPAYLAHYSVGSVVVIVGLVLAGRDAAPER